MSLENQISACQPGQQAHTDDRVLLAKAHLGRPHVADLDLAMRAVDKDIVALDVAMNDRRGMAMEVGKALQQLLAPSLDDL